MKQDFDRWDLLSLSLGERTNSIKMIILAKLLYIFQSLPIFLTKSFCSNLHSQISTFIWNKKPSRIKGRILQRPRKTGGMSLPNFLYYYWSANIRAILYWLRNDVNDSWVIIERASMQFTPLSILCAKLPLQCLSKLHQIQL